MTPSDLAADLRALWPMEPEEFLYWLADRIALLRVSNYGVADFRLCERADYRRALIEVAQAVEMDAIAPHTPANVSLNRCFICNNPTELDKAGRVRKTCSPKCEHELRSIRRKQFGDCRRARVVEVEPAQDENPEGREG